MELRVNVDDHFIKNLQDTLNIKSPEIAKSALTILNWAVSEASKGRVILSSDDKGDNIHRLAMPVLDAVPTQKAEPAAANEK